ncbi:Fe2+-dependent dioxygenase [Aquipseudomonas ullengensis]|uniref:Fe2+-dependent dioxygenase n=1 Tax=Aquipseudomonas ullengensis TaxID=2759166 RepID=A0A7W4QA48_9GAMM|nr:Fe2+-dependent dioxygenase [Pseudomonas ullengensis]MBB2495075.1 Fe2+-dependent dioxygenase [Pseudomonas ullengensis]
MMVHIPRVLSPQQVAECRQLLLQARWSDGKSTAGHQAITVKDNLQLPVDSAEAKAVGQVILQALERNPLFISAALPQRILAPRFNCYQGGQAYGLHVDNAIMASQGGERIRSDLSATLFLTDPQEYDGGELLVEDTLGAHSVKLPAGDLILYPSSSLHRVNPVTRGARISSFFWLQSMVRDAGERSLLFQLDNSVQQLNRELGSGHAGCAQLTGVYHNLLRRWAEV